MATAPKKDVIYIDTDDDITGIIEKLKTAKSPIVALVPPKRIGVLQSNVNLRLLVKAADTSKKRLVLITNDHTLKGMASLLSIPVAKNLQSKPEVPENTHALNEESDVIDGADLPVGEHAKMAAPAATASAADIASAAAATDEIDGPQVPLAATAAARAPKKRTKSGIPDFDSFRKRLFLFGGLGVLLLAFLIWALFFAGKATIAITAKTNVVNIDKTLQLRPNAPLDAAQAVLPPAIKELKKPLSIDFGATGKKDVGTKATGSVKFSIKDIDLLGKTVPAGTVLTSSGGSTYTTDSAVTFTMANYKAASTGITATASGSRFNGATGSVSGAPSGVGATLEGATTGGTDKVISIVSQDDFNKARDQLQSQAEGDSVKNRDELAKQFSAEYVVIQESFKAVIANPVSAPSVDQEAANAKMTGEATYRLVAVKRSDLKAVYDAHTFAQIDKASQKIYRSGDDKTGFSQFTEVEGGFNTKAQATAQVGPNINEKLLAQSIAGKQAGEIQEMIQRIQGVDNVNVKFSPFWVTKAPKDTKKIDIKFVVNDD